MKHYTVYSASKPYRLWNWDLRSSGTLRSVYY